MTLTIPRNEIELLELIQGREFEETIEQWSEEVRKVARDIYIEVAQKNKYFRQSMYAIDQKKTVSILSKDQTPQCEIEHELIKDFFDDRWKKGEPIDRNLADSLYKLGETIDEERKGKILEDLLDYNKVKEILRTRGNLSALGLDGITNPLLKLERDKGAKMLEELMKMITKTGFCPA
jgi:hypothetical protein